VKKKAKVLYPMFFLFFALSLIAIIFLIRFLLNSKNKVNSKASVQTIEGVVLENKRECFSGSDCSLIVEVESNKYTVVYLPTEGNCTNKVAPGIGYEANIGAHLKIFGKELSYNKLSICDSVDYFIKPL
jgi:hypothetical protein